jgi:hypothetical protein
MADRGVRLLLWRGKARHTQKNYVAMTLAEEDES